MIKPLLLSSFLIVPMTVLAADLKVHVPMEADDFNRLTEEVSGKKITVYGKHTRENVAGAEGNALRFDGYSTYATGILENELPEGASTFAVWVAPETYPIIAHDVATSEKAGIAGTIDKTKQQGWQFGLGQHGAYSFDFYSGGWEVNVEASDILPCYEWSYLVATVDPETQTASLYRNGEKVGERTSSIIKGVDNGTSTLTIGKTNGSSASGAYCLDTFNGLIDDVKVYDGILTQEEISSAEPENYADLSIPASRFAKDKVRPLFHGMPGANWTNETHGMTYSNGRYHVFFQKNANGPYMSRLHWGHISSKNLYEWEEDPIAIAPGEDYDIKGCWSGAVFSDDEITDGKPAAIYTGVDYEKARIVLATPEDEDLIDWTKQGVIINGRPNGLSDDFRDPYFFRDGDNAYIIVGTSKGNVGAATLHKYNPATKSWSNDGTTFFEGSGALTEGSFWEMPNLTKMENGKWLFTTTPQGLATGVSTLCWTGEIGNEGKFIPDNEEPAKVELMSRDGYGLLSPTIYQKDGKTLVLGIVPDKISTQENCELGWAHLYSFPREWSLDENNTLIQKPYEGLKELRSDVNFSEKDVKVDGTIDLAPVEGRQLELYAKFTVSDAEFGFEFFKNSKGAAKIYFNPSTNQLILDVQKINRINNDNGVYNGYYACVLPEKINASSEMTLDVFVDGSIVDIFVNDKWATSVRVYPNDSDADGVAVYSQNGATQVSDLGAWVLKAGNGTSGVESIIKPDDIAQLPAVVSVFTIDGRMVKNNVKSESAIEGLEKGIYIVGNRKVVVK